MKPTIEQLKKELKAAIKHWNNSATETKKDILKTLREDKFFNTNLIEDMEYQQNRSTVLKVVLNYINGKTTSL